jgi:hypothetical protein
MKIIKKLMPLLFLLALLPGNASSATNPIKWTLTQDFPTEVVVQSGTYVATYTLTNQMPFTMVKSFVIQKNTNAPSEFTYNDLCTGQRLAYLASCTVTIYLNPTSAGRKTMQIIEVYGNDEVPLPMLTTTASGNSGGTGVVGVVTTALPTTIGINVGTPWKFTFTNNGTAAATGINIAVSGSTYNTNCTSELSNVSPGNSCYVQGTYTATAAGAETVSASFSYTQGSPVNVSTSTTANGANGGLVCTATVPFAPQILRNSTHTVTLLCTNQSGGNITITGHTSTYPGGGATGTFAPTGGPGGAGDNCTNQTLANSAACQLSGVYTAPGSDNSPVEITLQVNYNASSSTGLTSSTSTRTSVVNVINNTRTISLVNNCNFNVWWSMVGGAVGNTPACTSTSDCPIGSTCNVAAKICYYNNYGTAGSFSLAANGGVATTEIIESVASQNGDNVLWSGLISASTQCSGASCLNNDCQSNGGTTSCTAGVGFQQPATEAEFTLMLTDFGPDTYDISNVNGFSMPISMATNQTPSEYTCGTAGNNVAAGNLKACNFSSITPPTNMYYWVSNTSTACSSQNTCSNGGEICGLAFVPTTNSFSKMCGNFLGYWAANQICQTDPSFSSPFGDNFTCNQLLDTPFPSKTYTLTQLLKCSPPNAAAPLFNSCYLSYAGSYASQLTQCCGCTDWSGIANPSASCPVGQTDPQWTTYVQPLVQWMKQACPTSYSYPFDDKASTFQCPSSSSTVYTITFCPGSAAGGLPSGKTDGR